MEKPNILTGCADAVSELQEPPNSAAEDPLVLHQAPEQVVHIALQPNKMRSGARVLHHPTRFTTSARSRDFHKRYYSEASTEEWNDWRWQVRNRIRSVTSLYRFVPPSQLGNDPLEASLNRLPVGITPYFMSLLTAPNGGEQLRRTVVPSCSENLLSPGESADPLGEESDSPVPGLVHRYPDRVLFLVTGFCSVYCRYCTRSRMVGHAHGAHLSRKTWERAIEYIESHKEVRDVLISGGDPLTLADDALDWLLTRLRKIRHVEFIRIGTKTPVVLPQRITNALTRILKKRHPLWMSLHFSHPDEITPECKQACERLADAGIPLGSQTVLLKGVNDNVETMKRLVQGLLKIRVRPYYLYQCDPIVGSAHFRTAVEKGLEIIRGLRGFTTGYAVPTYVIDAPGGGGKIPISPDYVLGHEDGSLVLKNYEGRVFRYPEPGRPVSGEGWEL